jgi:hypothetical protein
MKKLLLLSALLIFACSSDDSNDNNNDNSSTKKLASVVTLYPCSWCERENSYLSYTNDRLTLVEKDYFVTEENGDFMNGGEDNSSGYYLIEHLSNSIRVTYDDGLIIDIPFNSDGYIYGENMIFDNGYLISQFWDEEFEGNTSSWTENWEWDNGNLIRREYYNYYNGSLDDFYIADIEYTEYDDLTEKIGSSIGNGFLGNSESILISILGLRGKSSTKLPYRFTIVGGGGFDGESTSVLTYSYVFDEDGYPIQVVENDESSDGFSRTTRYELTYTN